MTGLYYKHWEVLVYFLIAFFVFRHWLGAGYIGGVDFAGLPPRDAIVSDWFQVWNFGGKVLGFSHASGHHLGLTNIYFWYVVYGLSLLELSPLAITKVILVIGLFLVGFNMRLLTLKLTGNRAAAFVSGLIYMINPVVSYRFANHFFIMMGYAFLPLALLAVRDCLASEATSLKKGFIAPLCIIPVFWHAVTLVFFCLLIGLFVAYYFIIARSKLEFIKSASIRLPLLAALFFGLNAVWLLPVIAELLQETPFPYFVGPGEPLYWGQQSQFINVIRLYSFYSAVVTNPLVPPGSDFKTIWLFFSWVIPIAALGGLFIKKYKETALFFGLMVIVFVPLAMGTEGFKAAWLFLFSNSPFDVMKLFRDPTKFTIILPLAYSVLVGITFSAIFDRLRSVDVKRYLRPILTCLCLLIVASPFVVNYRLWTESEAVMYMNLNGPPEAFFEVDQVVTKGSGKNYRAIWLPLNRHSTGYTWANYEMRDDVVKVVSPTPTVIYDPFAQPFALDFVQYSYSQILNQRSVNASKLLGLASIKYVVLREDVKAIVPITEVNPGDEKQRLVNNLKKEKGLELLTVFPSQYGSYTVYENKNFVPMIYAANGGILVVGGLNTLAPLADSDFSFENYVLFFAEQLPSKDIASLLNNPSVNHILIDENNNISDLEMSLIDDKYALFPYDYSSEAADYDKSWCKIDHPEVLTSLLRSFKQSFTPRHGAAASRGNIKIAIPLPIDKADYYEFWLRLSFHPNAGLVRVFSDGDFVGEIRPSQASGQSFRYVKLGVRVLSQGEHTIELENYGLNIGGLNIVEKVIIVPEKEVNRLHQLVDSKVSKKKVVHIGKDGQLSLAFGGDNPPSVNFEIEDHKQINMNIKSDGKPFFVFFSQAFSQFWKLSYNGEEVKPILANAFGNAFYVAPAGDGTVEARIKFQLEDYLKAGQWLVIATLLAIAVIGTNKRFNWWQRVRGKTRK